MRVALLFLIKDESVALIAPCFMYTVNIVLCTQ